MISDQNIIIEWSITQVWNVLIKIYDYFWKVKSDKIKLKNKQPHEFISSTIKPSGTINADTLSTLLRDPIYNIERAKGFFKDNKGELCTIQYDGLTLEIKKAENEKDPVFVVIGKKNFYNEKEFVEKLNTIQTK